MFEVCIHYPLNPEMSKTCMAHEKHDSGDISELEIPFSKDLHKFDLALSKLDSSGIISGRDARVVYERVKREKKVQQAIINEGLRFIPMEEPTLLDLGGRSVRKNQLDLNDPRIAEINIKYRD